jgi:hypothetical protein
MVFSHKKTQTNPVNFARLLIVVLLKEIVELKIIFFSTTLLLFAWENKLNGLYKHNFIKAHVLLIDLSKGLTNFSIE